ncbi:FxLD family lanthipeptide [Micromonospora sp. LOL_023]
MDNSDSLLGVSGDPFDLDVEIVTEGPVAAALLADTDDGCDTRKGGDC